MNLDHEQITKAIGLAEKNTSGEIQVVVSRAAVKDAYEAAVKAFERVGLGQTKDHNAILFFIAEKSRNFAIIGDKGIHGKVHDGFWAELKDELSSHFRRGEFTQGLCKTIASCGEKLKAHFPCHPDDANELSDSVHVEE